MPSSQPRENVIYQVAIVLVLPLIGWKGATGSWGQSQSEVDQSTRMTLDIQLNIFQL